MSVYTYPQSKLIDEVIFRTTERGAIRAYMHATPSVDANSLQDMINGLRKEGMACIPYSMKGKPMLEVRGFKWQTQLVSLLEKNQWTTGPSTYVLDKEDQLSFKEKLKKRSLEASGWLYSVGDAAFFGYGFLDNSPLDMAAGIFYGLPTPVLIAFDRNDQSDFQIKDAARKLADYLKKEELPQDCSLQAITTDHKKGLIQTTNDLFRRYPSEFMNLSYAAAGACIMTAGIKHMKRGAPDEAIAGWAKHFMGTSTPAGIESGLKAVSEKKPSAEAIKTFLKEAESKAPDILKKAKAEAHKHNTTENWLNIGVGSFTMASGIFGTVVKEKARDPDDPKKTGAAGMWEWVQERPLTITGVGLMVSTMLHAVSTTIAMKGHDDAHKKAVWLRVLFVGSALLAELMVAISSKGHGQGVVSDNSVDTSVIALAAEMIVKKPSHMQDYLIDYVAKFLSRPEVLAMKTEDVTKQLREQVEAMRKNPWALTQASKDQTTAAVPVADAKGFAAKPDWKNKVASAQPSTGTQPHLST